MTVMTMMVMMMMMMMMTMSALMVLMLWLKQNDPARCNEGRPFAWPFEWAPGNKPLLR